MKRRPTGLSTHGRQIKGILAIVKWPRSIQIYGQMCLEFKLFIVAITDLMPMCLLDLTLAIFCLFLIFVQKRSDNYLLTEQDLEILLI